MKKLLLISFFFCYSFINAQISFERGYFISNNGERTECFIKNLDWYNNPTDFKYKISLSDNEFKTETITNVKEFGIDNNIVYKRANVKIDISSNRIEYLSTTKNPIWKDDIVFLKILVKGDATLYQYTLESISKFFYETNHSPLEQLVYKEYLVINNINGEKTTEENKYYQQQLINNVKGENTSQNKIKRLDYKKDELTKYFLEYNNIAPDAFKKMTTNATKNIYLLKVTAGISFSSVFIDGNGSGSYGYKDVQYDTKIGPKIGLEGEYIFPFNKNKWSLFINPTYQKYEDNKDYGVVSGTENGAEIKYPSEIKYSGIQLPVGLRHYFFLTNNSKIFLNAAYVFDIGGKFSLKSRPINLESKTEGNFAVGIGYNFKNKMSTEIRMNAKKQLLGDYIAFSSSYSSIDFMLSYTVF